MNSRKEQETRDLLADLQTLMSGFGYTLIDIPIIEDAELFLTKAGDQIIQKLFTFERAGRQYALRPEFTAAAAYRYLQRGESDTVRWQFNGPVFEYRDHEASAGFQQVSAGAELIGAAGPEADAEVIALAAHGIMKARAGKWQLVIGHIGLMRQLLARFNLDLRTQRLVMNHRGMLYELGKQSVLEKLDQYLAVGKDVPVNSAADDTPTIENGILQMLDAMLTGAPHGKTMGGRTRADISRRLAYKYRQAAQRSQIEAALDALIGWNAINGPADEALFELRRLFEGDEVALTTLASWEQTIRTLVEYEIPHENVMIQPDLARAWDYYTGMVFELRIEDSPVAGGGRYDELMRIIGGSLDIPAVGFAFYIDNLLNKRAQNGRPNQARSTLRLVAGSLESSAAAWATQLRARGQTVILSFSDAVREDGESNQVSVEGEILTFRNRRYTLSDIDRLLADLLE